MFNKFEVMNTAVVSLLDSITEAAKMQQLREDYIKDPVGVISDVARMKSTPQSVRVFVDIFKTPTNAELAKEDCARELTTELLVAFGVVNSNVEKLISSYNDIILFNKKNVDNLLIDERLTVVKGSVNTALNNTPYTEMLESVIIKNMQTIQDGDTSSPGHTTVLSGIVDELKLLNLKELLEARTYDVLSGYIIKNTPVSLVEDPVADLRKVIDAITADAKSVSTDPQLSNYRRIPEEGDTSVSLLRGATNELVQIITLLDQEDLTYVFDKNSVIEDVVKKLVAAADTDPFVSFSGYSDDIRKIKVLVQNIALATTSLSSKEASLYQSVNFCKTSLDLLVRIVRNA